MASPVAYDSAKDAAATLSAQVLELHRHLSKGLGVPSISANQQHSDPLASQSISAVTAELHRRRLEDAQGLIQVNDLPQISPAALPDLRDVSNNDPHTARKRRRVEPSLMQEKTRSTSVGDHPSLTARAEMDRSNDIPVTAPRANYVHFTSSQPRVRAQVGTQHRSHAVYHQRPQAQPLTLTELLASPFLDPPTIPLHQRTMAMNAREYYASGSARRSVQAASKAGDPHEPLHSGNEEEEPRDALLREKHGDAIVTDGEELYSSSDSEDSSDAGGDDDDDGDWLTGFVKGQLNGLGGEQGSQEEVDELEDE